MLSALAARIAALLIAGAKAVIAFLRRRARLPLVRTVLQHWVTERRTLRQGIIALSIGVTITLAAGIVLGAMDDLLAELPGLLVLAPAAIGMRGAIFGALGARLGTGMLTGQLQTGWSRQSFLGQNVEAAGALSVLTAVVLAAVATGFATVLGLPVISFTDLVVVSVVGAVLSSLGVLGVVIVLSRTAQRQQWDMDAIGTPIISATADITTLPALVVGTLLVQRGLFSDVLGWIFVAVGVAALVLGLRAPGELARRVVAESLPILGYTALMGVLAGTVLEARKATLISSAALLVMVPPFIASSGAIGGILSARLSSQLHLGLVTPKAVPDRPVWLESTLTLLFAVMGFGAVGVLTWAAAALLGYPSPGIGPLLGTAMVAGGLAITVIVAVAYYAATASFRFGLDPDNIGIPLVTSTMDFTGILCLVAGITVAGAG